MLTRAAIAAISAAFVTGCATPGYTDYLRAQQVAAETRADAIRALAQATAEIAKTADPQTRTVAVMMMTMQAQNGGVTQQQIEAPRDPALAWAAILAPALTNIASGYFGYQLGKVQSNNAASTSIAGYNTMGSIAGSGFGAVAGTSAAGFASNASIVNSLKPTAVDWAGIVREIQPNQTIGGDGVIGSGSFSAPRYAIGGDGVVNGGTVTKPVTCSGGNSGTTGAGGSPSC